MTKKQKKLIAIGAVALVVLVALIIWILWADKALELSLYTVTAEALPEGFDGFCIAQVSDLHNAQMGEQNQTLLSMLRSAKPDIIVITGDLIDCRKTDIPVSRDFVYQALQIAPCYYVTGNHEKRIPEYAQFAQQLTQMGVTVLSDAYATLEKNGDRIRLLGVEDPMLDAKQRSKKDKQVMEQRLKDVVQDTGEYTILLSHRPEFFEMYADYGIDLVFAGHAHGGQIRLPLLGGVLAPNQGFFPKYDGGAYSQGKTHMIVSRGIGGSVFPVRINNRPELVVVQLQTP